MNKTPDMPAPAPAEAPAALRPLTTLSALIAARRIDHGPLPGRAEVHFHITDDWLQGRTTFGGLISALAAQAMRDGAGGHWPADVSLRAMQTSFVGPVSGGRGDGGGAVVARGQDTCGRCRPPCASRARWPR